MSKINYDEVPGCYLHCTNADCKMANHCLRQLAMQHLPNNQIGVTILNPQRPPNGEKCEYYRDDKPQIYGKGFKNMQAKCRASLGAILTLSVAKARASVRPKR